MEYSPIDLHVESYTTCSLLPIIARQALATAEVSNMEQGQDWLSNLIDTVFKSPGQVFFYALYSGSILQALMPIRLVKQRHTLHIEPLGNFYTSLYQPFLSHDLSSDSLGFLFRKILEEHPSVSSIRFSPMDVNRREYQLLLAAVKSSGLIGYSFFCFGNWYLLVKDTWSVYLAERSGQVKSTIKRKSKEFQRAGGLIELILGGEQLEYAIKSYCSVYRASWKVPEPYPEFIPGLIRFLSRKGWLRLGVASINGQAVAAQIWIVAHGKASIFKLAYHEEFKHYSAGTLLTAKLMEHVIDNDFVKEIDYLIGDDPYKSTWMNQRRERWGIIAYNLKTIPGLVGCGRELLGRLIKPFFAMLPSSR